MTRKEFLQYMTGSVVVLFGLSNWLSLLNHFRTQPAKPIAPTTDSRHGFGSRKFGE